MSIKYRETFTSPYPQYRDRIGQRFTVLHKISEVLPMYKIRFEDGHETSAWPEEVEQ
jgi:hypothetical protein